MHYQKIRQSGIISGPEVVKGRGRIKNQLGMLLALVRSTLYRVFQSSLFISNCQIHRFFTQTRDPGPDDIEFSEQLVGFPRGVRNQLNRTTTG